MSKKIKLIIAVIVIILVGAAVFFFASKGNHNVQDGTRTYTVTVNDEDKPVSFGNEVGAP